MLKQSIERTPSLWRRLRFAALIPALLLAGCAVAGFLAQAAPRANVKPSYDRLNNETVAIVVDADPAQELDFPNISGDLASAIKNHLDEAKSPLLSNTRYVDPYSVVQFQRNHPELKGTPLVDLAPRLGATRVLYIELRNFSTRSNVAIDLFRGSALSNVRVVEVTPHLPGSAKVAFTEDDIRATFPTGSGEGAPLGGDVNPDAIYLGTVQSLALSISERFYEHPQQDDTAVNEK